METNITLVKLQDDRGMPFACQKSEGTVLLPDYVTDSSFRWNCSKTYILVYSACYNCDCTSYWTSKRYGWCSRIFLYQGFPTFL